MVRFGIKLISTTSFYNSHFSFFEFFGKSQRCHMVLQDNGTSANKLESLIKKLIQLRLPFAIIFSLTTAFSYYGNSCE